MLYYTCARIRHNCALSNLHMLSRCPCGGCLCNPGRRSVGWLVGWLVCRFGVCSANDDRKTDSCEQKSGKHIHNVTVHTCMHAPVCRDARRKRIAIYDFTLSVGAPTQRKTRAANKRARWRVRVRNNIIYYVCVSIKQTQKFIGYVALAHANTGVTMLSDTEYVRVCVVWEMEGPRCLILSLIRITCVWIFECWMFNQTDL